MKSSQFFTAFAVAIILAIGSFFLAGTFDVNGKAVAIGTFLGAILGACISLLGKSNNDGADSSQGEVKTLYVGNLPYRANEAAVRELFSSHGVVHSVRLMKDKHTGKRRGFGFVEMSAQDADSAISALNDTEFQQRTLKVREAKERPEKSDSPE